MRKSESKRELTICSRSPGLVGGRARLTQLTLQPIPENGCTEDVEIKTAREIHLRRVQPPLIAKV